MLERIKKRDGMTFEPDSSVIVLAIAEPSKETMAKLEQAGRTLDLGIAHRKAGRFHEAENAYKDALRAYRSIADTEVFQATCTMSLGNVYKERKRFHEAENAYEDALKIYCSFPGTDLEQANCLANLSSCHIDRGQTSKARLRAQEALALCKSLPPEKTIEIRAISQWVLERTGEG